MNLLLDTHAFLWFIAGSKDLRATARELIEDAANRPFLSASSLWEMAIKLSLGKLRLALPFDVCSCIKDLNYKRISGLV